MAERQQPNIRPISAEEVYTLYLHRNSMRLTHGNKTKNGKVHCMAVFDFGPNQRNKNETNISSMRS